MVKKACDTYYHHNDFLDFFLYFLPRYTPAANKTTDKKILMCGSAWSKDLGISESKAIMSAKLKIADVTSHTMVRSEKVKHKENVKGVVKSYEMNADNQLIDVTIAGYRVLHKKILKEKNGWRTLVVLEYKLT